MKSSRAKLKHVRVSDLFPYSSAATRVESERIYLNENLTSYRRGILKEANQKRKDGLVLSAWSMDGKIFVKTSPDGRPIRIYDKQRDPISPYLFILVIEVLASLVRQNRQIEGIWIGEKHKKLELFADDSTFFLKDIASLNTVLKSIQEFYLFSSLKINTTKSEAGWIGSSKLDAQPTNDDGIKWINLMKVA